MVGGMAVQHLWLSTEEKQKQKQESRRRTKALRDQEATKGDKGKGRGKRHGGPRWMCGGPHFKRECPSLLRGRRGGQEVFQDRLQNNETLGFPSHTMEKARETAKGKGKEGKGQLSGFDENPNWGPPLGQMPYWDENSYPSELVPLCATVRNVTDEDEQGWNTVKGRKETNGPVEKQIMMMEVNSGGGTRFDVLEVKMKSAEDVPVLKADVQERSSKAGQYKYEEDAQEKSSSQGQKAAQMVKLSGLAALSRHSPRSVSRARASWRQLPSSAGSCGRRQRRQALH